MAPAPFLNVGPIEFALLYCHDVTRVVFVLAPRPPEFSDNHVLRRGQPNPTLKELHRAPPRKPGLVVWILREEEKFRFERLFLMAEHLAKRACICLAGELRVEKEIFAQLLGKFRPNGVLGL